MFLDAYANACHFTIVNSVGLQIVSNCLHQYCVLIHCTCRCCSAADAKPWGYRRGDTQHQANAVMDCVSSSTQDSALFALQPNHHHSVINSSCTFRSSSCPLLSNVAAVAMPFSLVSVNVWLCKLQLVHQYLLSRHAVQIWWLQASKPDRWWCNTHIYRWFGLMWSLIRNCITASRCQDNTHLFGKTWAGPG